MTILDIARGLRIGAKVVVCVNAYPRNDLRYAINKNTVGKVLQACAGAQVQIDTNTNLMNSIRVHFSAVVLTCPDVYSLDRQQDALRALARHRGLRIAWVWTSEEDVGYSVDRNLNITDTWRIQDGG